MKKGLKNIAGIKYFIILIIPVVLQFCGESPTESEEVKDPREYVWSIDTIKYPEEDGVVQSLISSVWGSSENDVYITGHADTGNRIFHYNGSSWEVIDEEANGIESSYDGEWIYGFAGNDIWVAGIKKASFDSPLYPNHVPAMLHYTGSKWEMHELSVEGQFTYTWGNSSNDIWACGDRGLVGYYDGSSWDIDTIQIAAGSDENFFIRSIIEYNHIAYAIGYKTPYLYFCKKSGSKWEIADSVETTYLGGNYPFGEGVLYVTSEKKLWSYGTGGVWEYTGDNSWTKIITTERTTSSLIEYTKGKFIIADYLGKVYYYSSGGLEEIADFGEEGRVYELWANSKECFVVVNQSGGGIYSSTLVFHGK
ncbi:MAG: hypothetical protein PVH88_03955 [Ignavibacteria bacterium]|jgi:hypothetical protein